MRDNIPFKIYNFIKKVRYISLRDIAKEFNTTKAYIEKSLHAEWLLYEERVDGIMYIGYAGE